MILGYYHTNFAVRYALTIPMLAGHAHALIVTENRCREAPTIFWVS
jgi:hypothetical protein